MNAKLLQQIETLHKALRAEGYDATLTIKEYNKQLILVVKLKDTEELDLENLRKIEGG